MSTAEVTASSEIAGVYVVTPRVLHDSRGDFIESWRRSWVPDSQEMIQANQVTRRRGCVVGLHYHLLQADYCYVPSGQARIVLHDLRAGSPTEGATLTLDVGGDGGPDHDHRGVYIPAGVLHGFAALTDVTLIYLVDQAHNSLDEFGVAWDDPEVAANWGLDAMGVTDPILSASDQAHPRRAELDPYAIPRWQAPRPAQAR